MPIDAYSPCPGGNGKKIKFCCGEFLPELQKIDRMLEGDQRLACLSHIERLQEQQPDRACLLATKGLLLRVLNRWEDAQVNAEAFVEAHPENPTALAELAIVTAVMTDGRPGLDYLQRALSLSAGQIQPRVYEAMGMVAEVLLSERHLLAARAMLQLQTFVHREDPRPVEMLVEMNRIPGTPLLLKDELSLLPPPEGVPWRERFEEALAPIGVGDSKTAAQRMAILAEEAPDSPAIWQNLAVLRGRLADDDGCIAALKQLTSLDIPLENAVEAEALALLLSDIPLGDPLEVLSVTWTVKDVDALQAALSLDGRVMDASQNAPLSDDDSPPPRATYLVFDRPIGDKTEDISFERISQLLCQARLFGRQTDREARLEVVDITRDAFARLREMLTEISAEAIDADSAEEKVVAEASASQQLLQRYWRLPRDATPEDVENLTAAYTRDVVLNHWPQMKLGLFDGRSPREVAGEESCRIKLLAAIMVLESWADVMPGQFDFNELRSQLGLPVLSPIDPREIPVDDLPLVRYSRVMTDEASDEALLAGYRRATAFAALEAQEKFALAIVSRGSLSETPERVSSFRTLAETARDSEKALDYIEQGRTASETAGRSSASWDLMELSFRLARREADHMQRLIQHIQKHHIEEPGVAESLMRFLISVGAIRPDGTPAQQPAPGGMSTGVAAEPAVQPGKLWTPDAQQSAGEKKIWTPD